MSARKPRMRTIGAILAVSTVTLTISACGSSSGKSGAKTSSNSKIVVGELLPFTGPISDLIKGFVTGINAAVGVINANGGVLGHQLTVVGQDTAGDQADAVPAWRALQLHHPAFEIGPTSLEGGAVINLYDAANIPDFIFDGSASLDKMTYKYVFRAQPSDSIQGTAMAAYALHIGALKGALLIANDSSSATLIPSLTQAYESSGGTFVSTSSLASGQSSYKSEIESVMAKHPDAVFLHGDEATAATIVKDMESLGMLNVPVISDDIGRQKPLAQAMGYGPASKYLVGVVQNDAQSAASPAYDRVFKQYVGGSPPPVSGIFYDGVNVFSLAMIAAKSTDPKVWLSFVTQVSNPPGTKCYDFVSCAHLLSAGQKINYEGADGNYDYNANHNIFTDYVAYGWNPDGTNRLITSIPQSDLAK
jgi:ABC-type branched-subunit amino acid transport system substrate-binding protein